MDYLIFVVAVILGVDGYFQATGAKSLPERVSGGSYSKRAVRWAWAAAYLVLACLLLVHVIAGWA